jgi:hypothetical protein
LRRRVIERAPADFTASLAARHGSGPTLDPFRLAAEAAVLAEISTNVFEDIPRSFVSLVAGGADGEDGWFALFVRAAAQTLYVGDAFEKVWAAEQNAVTLHLVQTANVKIDNLTAITGSSLAVLKTFGEKIDAMAGDVTEMAAVVRDIKAHGDTLAELIAAVGVNRPEAILITPSWVADMRWEPKGLVLGLETQLVEKSSQGPTISENLLEYVCDSYREQAVFGVSEREWLNESSVLLILKYIRARGEYFIEQLPEDKWYYLVAQLSNAMVRSFFKLGSIFGLWSLGPGGISVDRNILEGLVDLVFLRAGERDAKSLNENDITGLALSTLIDLAEAKILTSNHSMIQYRFVMGLMLYHFLNVHVLVKAVEQHE